MFVHQSNRLEILFQQFSLVIRKPLPEPLAPEIIVVHNQGMAHWVARQIAFATGIAANLQFPLPGRFVWDLFHEMMDDPPKEDLFCKPVLQWRIAALLPLCCGHPSFKELADYLRDDGDGRKQYQLTARISDVFDQYLVYRPDLLAQWEEERSEDDWQPLLWRRLTATALPHRIHIAARFRQAAAEARTGSLSALPSRFHLFGVNSLAPVYLDIIEQASTLTEVHLFHLSPCRHYWGDLVSSRRMSSLRRKQPQLLVPDFDSYYEQGHPLLVSLGATGQDFHRQLLDRQIQEIDLYADNDQDNLLATLHNDILNLHNRIVAGDKYALRPDDRSLSFHICHSPLREIQVLHDRLLDLFQEYADLSPEDILVTTPDIQVYAGAIAGVFGTAERNRRIPWSLADQSLIREQPVIRCFFDLIKLFTGRCTAPEVLALCETEALLNRFGLDPTCLPSLHTWVQDTGIRWGLDREHRCHLEMVAATEEHSWRFGLDRLLLGHLMGDSRETCADLLPYPHLAGNDTEELGGFIAFVETLTRWRLRLRDRRTPEDWSGELLQMLADFFDAEADDQGVRIVREAINGFASECWLAGYTEVIPAEIVCCHLEKILSRPDGGQVFQSGRVTFCNMVPMRSVPFRVVFLLGMNDGAFPRSQQPPGFDLMARHPRPGDRNRRQDDRYLFLEALLSARDHLAISWVGRNQRNDAVMPPSVVVSELRDYIDQSCDALGEPACTGLTTSHPLQPFSPRCFDGTSATASYNPAWRPAAPESTIPPFLSAALKPPAPERLSVDLLGLVGFWRHPVRSFLSQTLGLRLNSVATALEENEPFALDRLHQYHLRRETVAEMLLGHSADKVLHNFRAAGRLPHGKFGPHQFAPVAASSWQLTEQLRPLLAAPRPPLEVDALVGPFHLTGWLTDVYAGGRVTWSGAALKGATLVELWVHHLVLNLLAPAGVPLSSMHLTGTATWSLSPVSDPEALLRHLLDLYWQGLSEPLHFYPETSRAWAAASGSGNERRDALRAWEGGYQRRGEGEDPAYSYFFSHTDPLDPAFVALAAVFYPILDHLEEQRAAA